MVKKLIELKNSKLNRKLIIRLFSIFVITITYIVLITSNEIRDLESERLNDINNMLVESYSKESNLLINNAFETGDSLRKQIERLEMLNNIDYDNINDIVEPVLKSYDGLKGIFVLLKSDYGIVNPYWFKEGNKIKTETVDNAWSSQYWDAVKDTDRGLIKPQIYTVDDEKILLTTLEVPIKKNGEIIGIIGMDLTLEFFQSLSERLENIEGMEVSIISYDGMIIANPNSDILGMSLYDFDEKFKDLSVEEIIEINSNTYTDRDILHTRFIMGSEDEKWHILVSVPKKLINTIANSTSMHIGISGTLALLIIIFFSALAVSSTLNPIKEVCDVIEKAYNGDLGARTVITSGDEIESIGKGLNNLLSSLEKNREELVAEVSINRELNIELEELMKDNDRIYFDTIKSLVNTIEAKDLYTGGHCDRVTEYSLMIGTKLNLTRQELADLNYGAMIHDIGKIGVSESIICKVGRLTNDEFDLIKQHPKKGYDIVKDIHFLKDSRNIVLHHHERYDGKGYPEGLIGEEIDLLSRIVTITDAYDAMTSSRSYRSALSKEKAIGELINNKSIQFDPDIVDVFVELINNEEEL